MVSPTRPQGLRTFTYLVATDPRSPNAASKMNEITRTEREIRTKRVFILNRFIPEENSLIHNSKNTPKAASVVISVRNLNPGRGTLIAINNASPKTVL